MVILVNRAIFHLLFLAAFIVVDLIFIFKRSRNKEVHNGDDKSTPDIVENKYGNYCDECGATIKDNHKYCTNCGKGVRK